MIINQATALISPSYRTLTIYDRGAPLNVGPQIPSRPKGEPQAAIWAWCDDEGIDLRTASDTAPVAVTVILTDGEWGPVPPMWYAESIFSGPWVIRAGEIWVNAPTASNYHVLDVPSGDYVINVFVEGREAARRAFDTYYDRWDFWRGDQSEHEQGHRPWLPSDEQTGSVMFPHEQYWIWLMPQGETAALLAEPQAARYRPGPPEENEPPAPLIQTPAYTPGPGVGPAPGFGPWPGRPGDPPK
jgi:hypothetical protein